jgi:two-component system, cell cycle response regulator DivK
VKGSILVVEDNPDNQKLFAWILEDHGFTYKTACTAEEGLRLLAIGNFDLVLMDVSLPGMDGKEATRRIRAGSRWADLPVVAVTAHAIKGEDEQIRASGVSALVTKPIDENLLVETIRAFLPVEVSHGEGFGR